MVTVSMSAGPSWHANAVMYAIDVETFYDADGDGAGDFQGLIERLDYLDRLGVSVLWLLPFYPTPNRDNGYDVMDYYGVDERLGTLGDFVQFMHEANERGIEVIIDLVVNHTSDQHPWFQAARSDPDSEYRDYYIWTDGPPHEELRRGSVFPGEVKDDRVWTFDDEAGAYYYHRFYPFQPDLNVANPAVREEIHRIMTFWLELGVAGFRVDAATLMIEQKDPQGEGLDDPHEILRELKRVARRQRGDAILLAEADDAPQELATYFGTDGDEMDLLLNFVLNAHLIHALADEEAGPIIDGLERLPVPPEHGRWANFLRNYDELNIGRLPPAAQEQVFRRFAPDEEMRIYGRGIRRRLAPMLDGDRSRIKLALSLLFSMPGIPLIVYGDEIGMGDDLSLPGRVAVRTSMQWSDERNAGFSTAPADELVRPVIDAGQFGYDQVNVAAQRADPDSLLNWTERLIATRRGCPELGNGGYELLETSADSVLAMRYLGDDGGVVAVHNLAGERQTVTLDIDVPTDRSVNRLIGDAHLVGDAFGEVSLDGHAFVWYRIAGPR